MNVADDAKSGISRRKLLIGGGVGVGLLVAWGVWPRQYQPNMVAAQDEHLFGPWLKIAEDGKVIIAIPQSESGQGVYTALAQIVAGELGADWRSVAVQPVMPSPSFANKLLAMEWSAAFLPESWEAASESSFSNNVIGELATRTSFVVTGGSSSVRQFERPCREAGAAARALLCQAAAARWDTDWEKCETDKGFVVFGKRRLAFAELVVEAAKLTPPDPAPLRPSARNHLSGRDAPRLDLSAKVDGSASFAADIRLPDMLYASVRGGPIGDTVLKSVNTKEALKIREVVNIVRTDYWVAAVATNWWAANRALDAMAPVYSTTGALADSGEIAQQLSSAIATGPGARLVDEGDVQASFAKEAATRVYKADYSVAAAVHAPIETRSATAAYDNGRLQLWMASQAPEAARAAAAKAIGIGIDDVILYPVFAGGSFDRNFDNLIAAQVALIAKEIGRPVQLTWSRPEDFIRDQMRSPALARINGAINRNGQVVGLTMKVAAASTMRELANRMDGKSVNDARRAAGAEFDVFAIEGANPPYAIPNLTVDHFPVMLPIPTGPWRSMAHSQDRKSVV